MQDKLLKLDDEERLQKILKGKKIIISISGLDNVGKTTQAKMLHENHSGLISAPLHINQTEAFPKKKGKELSSWWFNKENAEEFVDTIYKALAQRYQMALECDEPIVIMDKGIDFYDTRVKATLLAEGFPEEQIVDMMTKARIKYDIFNSLEDLKIFITAQDRDYIKEEADDIYAKYIEYNIKLLNEKLSKDKHNEFRKIEFIENKPGKMQQQILDIVSQTLKVRTQYERYPAIIDIAKQAYGDNLLMLVLAGSAGKGKFIENWSDLDVYVVLKERCTEQDKEFESLLPNDIHVGYTPCTKKEIQKGRINQRTKAMFYELNQGKNLILYKDSNYNPPTISVDEILKGGDGGEYANAISNLGKCLNGSGVANRTDADKTDDISSKILKNIILLEKIALRNSNPAKVLSGYADTNRAFNGLLREADNNGFKIGEENKRTLLSVDLFECVQKHDDPEIQEVIQKYGEILYERIDVINDFIDSHRQTPDDGYGMV